MDQNSCTSIEGILRLNQSKVLPENESYLPFTTSATFDVVGGLPKETICLMKAARPKEHYDGRKKLLD
jgi:hypothetical protein